MKSLVKDIIVFIVGIIGEMYLFFQQPYLEIKGTGHFDGLYVLFPLMILPLIGLVIGIFIKSNSKYAFVIVTLLFSVLFIIKYFMGIDEIVVVYVLAYLFNTAVGIGIGHGIRVLALSIVKKSVNTKANRKRRAL